MTMSEGYSDNSFIHGVWLPCRTYSYITTIISRAAINAANYSKDTLTLQTRNHRNQICYAYT